MAAVEAAPRPAAWRIWWLASRPRTWPAAITPVAVGTALAVRQGCFAPGPALAALGGALLLQVSSNLANDYFDWAKGADTEARVGPTRVTQAGWVTPRQIGVATALCLALATLVGVYLVAVAGWPIAVAGLLAIGGAVAYTGGPWAYGYKGLGEVAVFLFFGLMAVAGTYFVQAGQPSLLAFALAVPVGAWAAAILAVNNLRDADTDQLAGKRTLAVRGGPRVARGLYAGLLALGYLVPVALVPSLGWGALAPLLTLPMALGLWREVARPAGPHLNATLAGTAKLMLWSGLALALGIAA